MKRTNPPNASRTWIWEDASWPDFTWNQAELARPLAAARRAQGQLAGAATVLAGDHRTRAQADLLLQDALNTSLIEGEHPDPSRVRSSIARHLGLSFAGLPAPDKATEGLVDVLLDASTRFDAPLTLERLCAWQGALFPDGRSALHRIIVGELRGEQPMRIVSGPMGREKVHYEAVPKERLSSEMAHLLDWFARPPAELDGLLRAGIAHLWFELIHPFEDGNGRVGRALMDMALAQDERRGMRLYSLSAQFMKDRSRYYELLEHAGQGGLDVTGWLVWFCQETLAACSAAQSTLRTVLAKTRFWMRHAGAPINERQRKVLNRLLDAGPAGFEGAMTTRKYLSLASVSRATAFRELQQLVELGCVAPNAKGGRSTAYDVDWSGLIDA